MQTEATHVTRMKNRRRVIMMIIPGAISQRGIKRTPDEAAINIAQKIAPFTIGTFLRKHKTKVNNERQKQITKFPTHGMAIPDDQKKEARWECYLVSRTYNRQQITTHIAIGTKLSVLRNYPGGTWKIVTPDITVCLFSLGRHRRQC